MEGQHRWHNLEAQSILELHPPGKIQIPSLRDYAAKHHARWEPCLHRQQASDQNRNACVEHPDHGAS